MSDPQFRTQSAVWSLSDDCFVIPEYTSNPANLASTAMTQVLATLGADPTLVQSIDTRMYVSNGQTEDVTDCPTDAWAGGPDPFKKCPIQPPHTRISKRLTVATRAGATSPLQSFGTDRDAAMAAIKAGPVDSAFWLLQTEGGDYFTVRFPPAV
ncbi:MAG: hypothetical protein ABI678_22095 [Kofleriaceae bacterium]